MTGLNFAYPVKIEERYVIDPSPIPKFDNPKLETAALQLFGTAREQRISAIPSCTQVANLDFEDHPSKADHPCAICGAQNTHLDEVIADESGRRIFACSDTDYRGSRRAADKVGAASAPDEDASIWQCKIPARNFDRNSCRIPPPATGNRYRARSIAWTFCTGFGF